MPSYPADIKSVGETFLMRKLSAEQGGNIPRSMTFKDSTGRIHGAGVDETGMRGEEKENEKGTDKKRAEKKKGEKSHVGTTTKGTCVLTRKEENEQEKGEREREREEE